MYEKFFTAYIKKCNDFVSYANEPILFRTGEDVGKECRNMELDDIRKKINMNFTYEIAEKKIVFTVGDSIEAKASQECEKPVCHMFRGFFKEISKNILGPKVRCMEETCRAKGDIVCKYVVEVEK
jgi:predicted hydrocarbon binding protein